MYFTRILYLSFFLKIYDGFFRPLCLTTETDFKKTKHTAYLLRAVLSLYVNNDLKKTLKVTSEGERWNKSLGSLRSSQAAMAVHFLPIDLERDMWFAQSSGFCSPGRIILSFPLGR